MQKIICLVFALVMLSACSSTSTMNATSEHKPHLYSRSYETIYKGVLQSVTKVGWSVKSSDSTMGIVVAETGMNLLTWGDTVTIMLNKKADKVQVDVSSTTSKQLIPSGLSESNIASFYTELEKTLN